jgi:DNA-binding transcriptional LysR family regulator
MRRILGKQADLIHARLGVFTLIRIDVKMGETPGRPMLTNVADLDLRLIRVFLAIVDAGGLSAAQATLNVGQSTLSSQLATLETRLGFSLCQRGRGGFRLTAKGERFVQLARRLVYTLNDFSAEARNMDRQLVGTLQVGLIGHAPMNQNVRIGQAIERFRQRDEAVRLSLLVRAPGELEELLVGGQIQVAVGYFWHRVPTLEYTPLFVERQVAYCSPSHSLASRAGRVTLEELVDADWAWRSYPLPEARMSVPTRRVTAVADNMEAVAVLILSGQHLGYLPEHFAAPYVKAGLLCALNVRTLHYNVTFHMASKKRAYQDEITRAFIEDMRAVHLGLMDEARDEVGRFTRPAG